MNVKTSTNAAAATIQGVRYDLAPKTLQIRSKIKELSELELRCENGDMSFEDALKFQIDFIRSTSDCRIFDHIPLDMIDITEVEIAVIAILNGYRGKVMKEKLKSLDLSIDRPVKKKKKK